MVKSCWAGCLIVLAFLLACGGGDDPIVFPALDDCATLASEPSLSIKSAAPLDFTTPVDDIDITVGQSQEVYFWPPIASECRDQLTAEWRVADGQVASVLADEILLHAWVTGLSPGTTRLSATLRFSAGAEREAQSPAVQVSPTKPPPAGSIVIVEGETGLAPSPGDGVTPADFRRFVPFTTTFAGHLYLIVD